MFENLNSLNIISSYHNNIIHVHKKNGNSSTMLLNIEWSALLLEKPISTIASNNLSKQSRGDRFKQ